MLQTVLRRRTERKGLEYHHRYNPSSIKDPSIASQSTSSASEPLTAPLPKISTYPPTMDSELPPRSQLTAQVINGRPITQSEASAIAHAESDMTRRGPIKGGTAATAQSLHDRQQNFYGVAGEVARKPSEEVTREDAARVQHFEVCRLFPSACCVEQC